MTRGEIKNPFVQGTDDRAIADQAVCQRAAGMGAVGLSGEYLAAAVVKQGYFCSADFEYPAFAGGYLRQ